MEPRLFILDRPERRASLLRLIQKLPLEDGQIWDIKIKPYEPKRSDKSNRRLWALHNLAAQATGHSSEELHELMKAQFLPRSFVKIGGVEREVPSRSSKLTSKQFAAFMTRVEEFYISELGIFLGSDD